MPYKRRGSRKRTAIRKIKPRKRRNTKAIRLRTQHCLAPAGYFVECRQLAHHLMMERRNLTPRRHNLTPRKPKTPKQVIHDGPQ
jgi:hypothetical protein